MVRDLLGTDSSSMQAAKADNFSLVLTRMTHLPLKTVLTVCTGRKEHTFC